MVETPQLPLYVTCTNDFPDSSDDEEEVAAPKDMEDEDAAPIEMLTSYALWSNHVVSPYKEMWPVKIEFGPLNPKGTLFDTAKRPNDGESGGVKKSARR